MSQQRHFKIVGAYNLRDIGGYETTAGGLTRWGRLLRGDLLAQIPAESQAELVDFGIKTAIDLRTKAELLEKPSVLSQSLSIEYLHHDLLGDDDLPSGAYSFETAKGIADGYTWILEARQLRIKEILATLAAPGTLPAVFYCAGGTDRTGIIAALVLGIVGVPHETIAEDYRLSARGLIDRFHQEGRPDWLSAEDLASGEAFEKLAQVETMDHTLGYLERAYGSVSGYVRTIGLTDGEIEGIRDALVA